MGHIYENAVCNLAATAAADEVASHHENLIRETGQSKTGLYTNRRITSMFPPLVTVVRSDFPAQQFFAITSKMRADLHEENLLKRGWVLQERLLSPRTVYFGEQLIWECAELLACETFPHGVPTRAIERDFHQGYPQRIRTIMNGSENNLSIYKPSRSEKKIRLGDKERLYLRWFYLVRRYAALDLTYQSDRLPALSGLAKKFQEMLQENYLAGLWRMYILPGLLWRSESLKEVSKEYIGKTRH